MMLEQIESKLKRLQETRRLVSVTTPAYDILGKHEGKTVGLKIDPKTRARLDALGKRIGAPSYKATVGYTIEVGLRALELLEGT
jgi:hypothetical protein